ncbi:hypothetical protein, partial [Enterobacter cloacae complex sp. GF14B]|uniref:hypothetical protein n=1 Tax=Enterobacter cloacae complex sp. GF14B TaxID=2511982 RepID=UPI001026BDD0
PTKAYNNIKDSYQQAQLENQIDNGVFTVKEGQSNQSECRFEKDKIGMAKETFNANLVLH